MAKLRLTGATFDASAKTVLHTSFSDVTLAGIQLIVNVTDQIIIYNFADTTKGGTLATDTLTLEYDTTTMSDTDELMILVEDGTTTQPVSGTVTVTGVSTAANQTTIIGHLDGVEGLLTTIDGDTGAIATSVASIDTKTPALGQALAAASVPVVLTAAQLTTLTPPAAITGFATSANQTTIIGHVDGIEGLLTTLAGTVGGTELQVDVLTMPSVTVTATNLDIRDLTNVDVVTAELSAVDNAVLDAIAASVASSDTSLTDIEAALETVGGLVVNLGANNDVTVTGTVDLGATDNAVLDAIAASVAAIDTDTTTIIGHVDGIETLIGTTNTTLTTIDGRVDGIEGLLTTIDADTGNIVTSVQLLDDTVATLGTTTYTETTTKGLVIGAVRRDADTTLVDTTNEIGPLQMNALGQLKVEVFSGEALPVTLTSTTITGTVAVTQSGTWDEVGINDSGNSITVDAVNLDIRDLTNADVVTAELSAVDNAVLDAIAASVASSDTSLTDIEAALETAGGLVVNLGANNDVTVTGTVDLGATDNAVLDAIAASVAAIDTDATTIIGHVDGIEGLLGTIDADTGNIATAVTSKYITGMGHGVTTVTTAGTDVALAGSTACKRVIIQSQTDNTNLIAVGATGVDATIATGTGVVLYPGDSVELDIDNLADIFIDSLVNGEGVRYTYFT